MSFNICHGLYHYNEVTVFLYSGNRLFKYSQISYGFSRRYKPVLAILVSLGTKPSRKLLPGSSSFFLFHTHTHTHTHTYIYIYIYRGADTSLARPGRKNKPMFLSEWRQFPSAPCLAGKEYLDDSSRLDVVEIARVPYMLPSLFPSWSRLKTYQHPVYMYINK